MPRTRSLETYANRQFLALVKRTIALNAPVLIPCTRPQAASMRGEMHAWRRAAEGNPDSARHYGIDLDMLRQVALRITAEGMECIPQSLLVTPSLIENALGPMPGLISQATSALDRLRNLVSEDATSGS